MREKPVFLKNIDLLIKVLSFSTHDYFYGENLGIQMKDFHRAELTCWGASFIVNTKRMLRIK